MDALTAHYGSLGRLADYRRQFEKTTRTVGEDPAIFATALETLAVKAFGDMGRTAQLRLIRDRSIAGHSNCDLRRHLDSVPPETPIRDIVDRCRVWESHADPASRRLTKLNTDPIYPAYVVGKTDFNSETTRVAEVTGHNSESHQLEDLLRRVLSTAERRETITAAGKRDTESTNQSLEPHSDDIGEDATLLSRRTAPATAATSKTATLPARLVRRDVFLLWEVGSCSDMLPGL